MTTMLYTKDGEVALARHAKPKKGVFGGKKTAAFYSVFTDDELPAPAGWVDWPTLVEQSEKKPETSPETKRRGRPPKAEAQAADNDASRNTD